MILSNVSISSFWNLASKRSNKNQKLCKDFRDKQQKEHCRQQIRSNKKDLEQLFKIRQSFQRTTIYNLSKNGKNTIVKLASNNSTVFTHGTNTQKAKDIQFNKKITIKDSKDNSIFRNKGKKLNRGVWQEKKRNKITHRANNDLQFRIKQLIFIIIQYGNKPA